MPPDRKRPPAWDRRLSESVLADGFDCLRDNSQIRKNQEHRHRADFARDIVFQEFGYRHARAIDYDGFKDRKPAPARVRWRP